MIKYGYAGSIRSVEAITLLQARTWNAQPREAMISIVGSGDKPVRLKRGWAAVLRLQFDDIKRPVNGGILFDDALADKVIDFLERIEGKVDHVVVHCNRGLSRGPAVARFITAACDLDNAFQNHMTFNRHIFRTLFWRWRHRVAPGQGGSCDMGYLEADDPVYRLGVMVAGRPLTLTKPEKEAPDEHERKG